MAMLTEDDHRFFRENGYLRVPRVVEPENCRAVVDLIYRFLGFSPDHPEAWYQPPLSKGGMLEVYQQPEMWENRQHPRMHALFAEIYGTERLHVSFDRVNFNPPVHPDHPEYDHPGMLHWDIDPATAHEAPFRVQGVLYLDDTPAERGGFCCVPGHHELVARWAATGETIPGQPAPGGRSPANRAEVQAVPVVGDAGDMVIWDTRLLHGNGRNVSGKPRLAQYITMWPAVDDPKEIAERVRCWRERAAWDAFWVLGDPRHWERDHDRTAELTQLGRRLLGAEPWPEPVG